MPRVLTTVAL